MSFLMHFFFTDYGDFDWDGLREGLQTLDPQYDVVGASPNVGLRYGSGLYGRMEFISVINRKWIVELRDEMEHTYAHFREGRLEDDFDWEQVKAILNNAQAVLEIKVVWQGRQPEDTLQRIDPIWSWLFCHRSGAVYDVDGWHNKEGRIIPIVRPSG
jgi:hypothetical protein